MMFNESTASVMRSATVQASWLPMLVRTLNEVD